MRALCFAVLAFGVTFGGAARADEGKLDRARDAIGGSEPRSRTSMRGGRSDREDADCSFLCALASALFADDEPDPDRPDPPYGARPSGSIRPEYGYARYPYARRDAHYLVPRDVQLAAFTPHDRTSDLPRLALPRAPRGWAGNLSLDAGHFGGVTRTGITGRVMLPDGFELDARYGSMLESAPARAALDYTSTGTGHVTYRVLGAHMLLLRVGAGLRYWADHELAAAGVDLTLGLDVFPIDPLVISAHVSGGSLGAAFATDTRIQLGLALDRVEVFAGFEWMHVDDIDLSMPVLGTRLWL